jgi:hypothetical protein
MITWEDIGNFCIILLMCFIAAGLVSLMYRFSQPIVTEVKMVQEEASQGDMRDFLIIAQRFAAEHDYDFDTYNCVNYSYDLGKVLDQVGIGYEIMRGCREGYQNKTSCHQWLRLKMDFEPQSGSFVDYSKTYPEDQWVVER